MRPLPFSTPSADRLEYKLMSKSLLSDMAQWERVRQSGRGGIGFAPMPRHTKDVKIIQTAALLGVEHIT